jgi:uncharacterized membrane protein YfcA
MEQHRRAGARHDRRGGVGLDAGALAGSILGSYLGAAAIRQGNLWIKRSFEIVTILIGIKLILD